MPIYLPSPTPEEIGAQPLDADLTAIAALTTQPWGRDWLTLVSDSAARTALSLVPGTHVQAYDADLAALAGLATTGLIDRTGAGTAVTRTTGATGLDLLAAATTAAARTTIGSAGFTQGTWTPGYIMSTSGSVTANLARGRWALWDDLCWFSLELTTASLSSPAGSVRLSLPFPNAETMQIPLTVATSSSWATAFSVLGAFLIESAQYIRLTKNASNAATADVVAADLAATGNVIRVSGLYKVTL